MRQKRSWVSTKLGRVVLSNKKKSTLLVLLYIGLNVALAMVGPHENLDTMLYYSYDQAIELFDGYTDQDKLDYLLNESIDMVYIFTYSYILVFFMSLLGRFKGKSQLLVLLPGACDFIETATIISVLFVGQPLSFFTWLGTVTFLKWISAGIIVLLLLIFSISHLVKRGKMVP
jgi:hypothetical protein